MRAGTPISAKAVQSGSMDKATTMREARATASRAADRITVFHTFWITNESPTTRSMTSPGGRAANQAASSVIRCDRRSVCRSAIDRCEIRASSQRWTTPATARSMKRAKIAPPTVQIAEVSPATKTRSNIGWSIQERRPRVLPSITMRTPATRMLPLCRLR